jgi:hypothetical protein
MDFPQGTLWLIYNTIVYLLITLFYIVFSSYCSYPVCLSTVENRVCYLQYIPRLHLTKVMAAASSLCDGDARITVVRRKEVANGACSVIILKSRFFTTK